MAIHGDPSDVGERRRWLRTHGRGVVAGLLLGVGAPVQIAAGWVAQQDRLWWLLGAGVCAGMGTVVSLLPERRPTAAGELPPDGRTLPGQASTRADQAQARAEQAQARAELLDRVRRTWIEGVLDRSLAQIAQVELGLTEQLGAVAHPWGTLLHQPGEAPQVLPRGTTVSQIAGRFDAHLLILGAPGAGKTTLLLEYARDLLDQAAASLQAAVPVVLHLSAWPEGRPTLVSWVVEELVVRYGVPRRLALDLVQQEQLALLLDGLDEVPQERRDGCVQAINGFSAEHGRMPLVVCARTREYQELAERLRLNGAVEVQPLDHAQVREWLQAPGQPLAGLRSALRHPGHWLWGLLDNPLWLSIAALTYRGQPARAISADGGAEDLLGAYVDAMLTRPRRVLAAAADQAGYAPEDTVRWLAWLAQRMGPESIFYPDWMQPDWLPTRRQRWLVTTGVGVGSGLLIGMVGMLVGVLVGALAVGLGVGLVAALGAALFIGVTQPASRIEPVERLRWSWRTVRRNLVGVLLFGLVGGIIGVVVGVLAGGLAGALALSLDRGLLDVLGVGLAIGLGSGLAGGLAGGFDIRPDLRPAAPLQGIQAAARTARVIGPLIVLVGLLIGALAGVLVGGMLVMLGVGLVGGLAGGLTSGMTGGGASYLRHRLLYALLRRDGFIPADLVRFLDYADDRVLLRRAGGGYLFIHRLLQDHLAAHAAPTSAEQRH